MQTEIVSQYKASLKMLINTIVKCPDALWDDNAYENTYWRIVYHALFYISFYLSGSEDSFVPFAGHLVNYNFLGNTSFDEKPITISIIYSKEEMMHYAENVISKLDEQVSHMSMDEKAGFFWLDMNGFELQLYTLRHLQHHTGQLIERLHQHGISGIGWVGRG